MKLHHHFAALCCAAALSVSALLHPMAAAAEEESSGYNTVYIDRSSILKNQPEGNITGEIAVIVDEHPVHVTITLYIPELPAVQYYDTDLVAADGSAQTKYIFEVNHSEYAESQASDISNTYTLPFLAGEYNSCYEITITAPDTKGDVYTERPILIADPHQDTAVAGMTRYTYCLEFQKNQAEPVIPGDASVVISDENADIDRTISMLWKPYTLGDVNSNDVIDMTDAYLILLYSSYLSAGTTPPMEIVTEAADVNGNGTIEMTDAYLTLVYSSCVASGMKLTFEEFLADRL